MTDSDDTADQIEEEIHWYQENSSRLSREAVAKGANWKNAPGTTPVSIRMKHSDVERLSKMAQDKGVSISHLVRGWLTERIYAEEASGIGEALEDFERSYATLRSAIDANR